MREVDFQQRLKTIVYPFPCGCCCPFTDPIKTQYGGTIKGPGKKGRCRMGLVVCGKQNLRQSVFLQPASVANSRFKVVLISNISFTQTGTAHLKKRSHSGPEARRPLHPRNIESHPTENVHRASFKRIALPGLRPRYCRRITRPRHCRDSTLISQECAFLSSSGIA